ncbi:MAG: prolipoprotein diacylglyceryl transferase [Desulfobulbus propionicus]|nr:MAG: prolipoprotein diacylglyceryl transferase [Desulfobulbus propionicus]
MLTYPYIDPVIFSLGPLSVRWYGLMYVIGFTAAYFLVSWQARRFGFNKLTAHLDNLNMTLIAGAILGGRLGYVLFYNLPYYRQHPLETFFTWQGGMSFHGGCIGVIVAGLLFCIKTDLSFWKTADLYVATAPIGLFFGRLGNFINGELFGRVTSSPAGMVFPDGGPLPRHPSQLYEAGLEGIVLFIILWSVKEKPWQNRKDPWPHGSLFALFLFFYGAFRFIIEFFREPDPQIGYLLSWMTMGQILCSLMAFLGLLLFFVRNYLK